MEPEAIRTMLALALIGCIIFLLVLFKKRSDKLTATTRKFEFAWTTSDREHRCEVTIVLKGTRSVECAVTLDGATIESWVESASSVAAAGYRLSRRVNAGAFAIGVGVERVGSGEPILRALTVNGVEVGPYVEDVELPEVEVAGKRKARRKEPQVVMEKETVIREKEVVKIRCSHCRTLNPDSETSCSNCGAPL